MKRKLLFPLLFALAAALLCAPSLAIAYDTLETGESAPSIKEASNITWTANDFTWEGTTVTGFSETGKKKFEDNPSPDLIIPDKNEEGNAVTEIGVTAFQGTTITSLTMPDTITTMGNAAFNSCPKLIAITLSKGLKSIPQAAFLKNGPKDPAIPVIEIPEGVTSISRNAFAGTKVSKLTLPESLESIGNAAFRNHQLTEIVLPKSITTLGTSAFSIEQENLPETLARVTLNDKLTSIGSKAFNNAHLENPIIQLPASVTTLDKNAFNGCDPQVTLLASTATQLESTKSFIVDGSGHMVKGDLSLAKVTAPNTPILNDSATLNPSAEFNPSAEINPSAALSFSARPNPIVTFDGQVVSPSAYDVSYENNTTPGTATVIVTAKSDSNYAGICTGTFKALSVMEWIKVLESENNTLKADLKTANEKAAAAEASKATLESENNTLKADLKTANEKAAAAEASKSNLENDLRNAEQKASAAIVAKNTAERKKVELEEEIEQLKSELKEAKKAITNAQESNTALQQEIKQLKSDLEKANKKDQIITVKTDEKRYSTRTLKKASKSFAIDASANGKGKLTYKVSKKNSKLSFKNGIVTVKTGTKAGTYTMKVKITAAAKDNYKKTSGIFTLVVIVK